MRWMSSMSWMNSMQVCAVALFLGCAAAQSAAADPQSGAAGAAGPWRSLLEGHSAVAWRGWKEPGFPAGWHVIGGVLSKDGPVDDLVTKDSFGDFELELEWKIEI